MKNGKWVEDSCSTVVVFVALSMSDQYLIIYSIFGSCNDDLQERWGDWEYTLDRFINIIHTQFVGIGNMGVHNMSK